MRDIAKEAGVSLSTVSEVLNPAGKKNVSPEIRERVMTAVEKLGYELPKPRKRDRLIAVVLPQIASTFYSNLLSGIEEAAHEEEYLLMVGNTSFSYEKERSFVNMIRKQDLCGILIDTVCPEDQVSSYYKFIHENFIDKGVPVMFMMEQTENDSIPCVYVDHEKNAETAVRHLLSLGRRQIAHISGPEGNRVASMRIAGYRKVLEKNGIEEDPDLMVTGDYTPISGYTSMKQLLRRTAKIDAVYAANDQMAVGAVKAILSEGKRIPEDIAIIGTDGLNISSVINPALTTIQIPTYQIGRTAAKMLIEKENMESVELSSTLLVRKSTNADAVSDWELFGW